MEPVADFYKFSEVLGLIIVEKVISTRDDFYSGSALLFRAHAEI